MNKVITQTNDNPVQNKEENQMAIETEVEESTITFGGCCHKTRMFARTSFTDVGRNKCNFTLAFFAVFIVVLSTLVVNSIIERGPVLFMSLAEK